MTQGYYPGKFPLHAPARKSVVRSYPTSPAVEPIKGVVTPESSPVKSRLEGNRCVPFVSLLIKIDPACPTMEGSRYFFCTYTNFDK